MPAYAGETWHDRDTRGEGYQEGWEGQVCIGMPRTMPRLRFNGGLEIPGWGAGQTMVV